MFSKLCVYSRSTEGPSGMTSNIWNDHTVPEVCRPAVPDQKSFTNTEPVKILTATMEKEN